MPPTVLTLVAARWLLSRLPLATEATGERRVGAICPASGLQR